jgi:hypothetical protein
MVGCGGIQESYTVEDRVIVFKYMYIRNTCLANYGASEAVNLWNGYVEKSTKVSEKKGQFF